MIGTHGVGIVLASYGRGVLVESGPEVFHCSLKSRKLRIVCGDRVAWTNALAGGGPAVESVEPRRNLIERIDARGRPEPVAANIDRLAIVVAPAPVPDWFVADRYWAAARLKDLEALLIVNKADLDEGSMRGELASYRALELPCHEVSALTGQGIEALRLALGPGTTFLVGQSGVGKSSIVNTLAPESAAETRALTRDVEGRHTTTTARRYRLADDSALVDAPGVRDFAPPATLTRAAEIGFVEIHRFAAHCRFNDCRHLEEPECAVRAAVLAGHIAARRHESYRRLFRLYRKLTP